MGMRILLVSRLYPLPENPGRGIFVQDHVHLLKSLGHEVEVLHVLPRMFKFQESRRSTMEGVSTAPKSYEIGGQKVSTIRHIEWPNWPSLTKNSIKRVSKKHRVEKPDVIIAHTLWPSGILASLLASRFKAPLISVIHGHDIDVAYQKDWLKKHIDLLMKHSHEVIAVSHRLQRQDMRVIPCHVSVGTEWQQPLRKWKGDWRNDRIELLFPADPRRPEKNHLLCLKTGQELESRGWQVGLTVLKKQPRSVVWDRMVTADVTLITSTREGGPLVAKEAICCGCPVVSVDVGDISEWLGKAYDATPKALADGIEEILRDGQEITLPQKFSFDDVSLRWKDLLESL
ncbi:MAG TPA: glycosyltransferase [Candidatus Poseidoniales archaeon]|nr:MAG TPA: glycosyltransferase [Candidatus Poseidoniales archaeon]